MQATQHPNVFGGFSNKSIMKSNRRRTPKDRNEQGDHEYTTERAATGLNREGQQPFEAARRYATSCFPFSPFSVIFAKEVREKTVIEELTEHATRTFGFELKIVAYGRGRSDDNEHGILIFSESSQSFTFLYEQDNWPSGLAENGYTMKNPSVPPQLVLVLP